MQIIPKRCKLQCNFVASYEWEAMKLQRLKQAGEWIWQRKKVRNSLIALVTLYLIVNYNFLWLVGSLPSASQLKQPDLPIASEVYASDGTLIGKFYRENRFMVTLEEINPIFYKGLISTEDVRFYQHGGIDWKANASIIWYLVKGDKRGASTISQQLAKNMFKMRKVNKGLFSYLPGLRTVNVKMKEWIVASRLESNYTKDEILLLYMNTVDFGSNAFGIGAAAKTYFSKTPQELTVDECAILIGMLKATTTYSPVLHPDKSKERRNVVLSLMQKHGVITQTQYQKAKEKPIRLKMLIENQEDCEFPYVRAAVAREISTWCSENGYDLYRDGLKIQTSIDVKVQRHAQKAVSKHMRNLQTKFYEHWGNQNPWIDANKKEIQGFLEHAIKNTDSYRHLKKQYPNQENQIITALKKPRPVELFTHEGWIKKNISVFDSLAHYKKLLRCGFFTIDPHTGHIKSWVGGIDYKVSKYDHIVQAKRQPGSTFKPFVYATALEQGKGPCDTRVDHFVKHEYEEDGEIKVWTPKNANRVFTNETFTLRHAMATSINSIAVQLTLECGPENVAKTAQKCGIQSELQAVPSIGLGSNDVNLLELTAAYAPFINGGYQVKPLLITRIENRTGKVIAEFKPEKKRAISEETAWLMSYMLRGTVEEAGGTSQGLWSYPIFFPGSKLGGKTGTSNNYSDGWYIGVSSNLIGGTWVGAEDRTVHFRTSATGEALRTALPVFGLFMQDLYRDKKSGYRPSPYPAPTPKIKKPHDCSYVSSFVPKDTAEVEIDPLALERIKSEAIDSVAVDTLVAQ